MKPGESEQEQRPLLGSQCIVINVGLESFAEALQAQNGQVVRVAWRPPPERPGDITSLLEKLL